MNSKEYWAKREAEQLKHNITDEKEYEKQLQRIYSDMLASCQKEINAFYGKYADKEGITLAEAKKKVSQLDIKEYERKAAKYVKDKDFSDKANEEMRLYNATMKINRLEMLKANIGLELIAGHQDLERFMGGILKGRTEEELKRQAGILGKTVKNNAQLANAIVNASFHNATFSDRVWLYQDLMKADLAKLLQSGMIQGKNARVLARELKNKFQAGTFNAERLMRTELARVQTEAQKQSFERNGFKLYEFIVNGGCCDICAGLNGKHFEVAKMMPGENAPPMHPHCRCSTAAYEDSKDYENWLDFLDKGGTTAEYNKLKAKSAAKGNKDLDNKQKPASLLTNNGKNDIMQSKYGFNAIQGKHTRQEDIAATNPHYSSGKLEYKENCQRCVNAFEARVRGYDVEALPAIINGVDRMAYILDKKEGLPSVYKGSQLIPCFSTKTAGVKQKVKEKMAKFGDGARAIISVDWQESLGGGGHVFIAEQINGQTIFYDPQNNTLNAGEYFNYIKVNQTYVMRIDNLEFTDNIKKCCKNRERKGEKK